MTTAMNQLFDYIPETMVRALRETSPVEVKGRVTQVVGTIIRAVVPGVRMRSSAGASADGSPTAGKGSAPSTLAVPTSTNRWLRVNARLSPYPVGLLTQDRDGRSPPAAAPRPSL